MIERREFGKTLVGGMVSSSTVADAAAVRRERRTRPVKNLLMHVGADYHCVAGGARADLTGRANLEYNLRHGVKHLTAQMRNVPADGSWDLDELKRMRDNCDAAGFILEAIRMDSEYIMLRPGPERDRRLEAIVGNIQKASQVGVKAITHHWTVIPIRRNTELKGRGGVTYAAFKLEDDWKNLPIGKAGRVTSDEYWERISHFLQGVIPVCKQYDVKMAAHPYDPPGLPVMSGDNGGGLKKASHGSSPLSNIWVAGAKYIKFICVISAEIFTISRRFTPTKERWIFSKLCGSLEMCNLASR